jgi:hypothetical protein
MHVTITELTEGVYSGISCENSERWLPGKLNFLLLRAMKKMPVLRGIIACIWYIRSPLPTFPLKKCLTCLSNFQSFHLLVELFKL